MLEGDLVGMVAPEIEADRAVNLEESSSDTPSWASSVLRIFALASLPMTPMKGKFLSVGAAGRRRV